MKRSDDDWKITPPSRAAQDFLALRQMTIHPLDPVKKYDRIRCQYLAIHRTDLDSLNKELGDGNPLLDPDTFHQIRRGQTYQWLEICVNTENPEIRFYLFTKDLDREDCVQQILYPEAGKLSFLQPEYQIEPKKRNYYLNHLSLWFLRRYNLLTALRLGWNLSHSGDDEQDNWAKRFRKRWNHRWTWFSDRRNFIPLVAVCGFLWLIGHSYVPSIWEGLNGIRQSISWNPRGDDIFFTTCLAIIYTLAVSCFLIRMLVWLLALWRNGLTLFRLLMPRMISGIVVGYMPLIFASDVWKMVAKMTPHETFLLVSGALGFSFFYLYTEIQNAVQNKRTAATRTLHVFMIGLFESFFIGLIVLDLITHAFDEDLANATDAPGFIGIIYPEVLYVYFPLALLIGILVQIIWEDKPITEPL